MNHGRIEQVGAPRELYEHPVNQFVMTFMGSVNRLGEAFVRPHDIELSAHSNGVTSPATIERLVYLGWEVRVDLRRQDDGERMSAQVTRDVADGLGLEQGGTVFVRPYNERVFAESAGGGGI
jgi:sulfate transport system ATP-binding protein